jgi:glycosyltransferase involved in cell wall biosynthesis
MGIGGFVIHGSNASTLPRCLDSIAALCDRLVAVDCGSIDGSAELAASRGFEVIRRPWEGYGAARRVAADALGDCEWLFFLDSDEYLKPAALEALRAWRSAPSPEPLVELTRKDWAHLGGAPFLYRTEHHVRLVRRDHARWTRGMIVHEALPPARVRRLRADLEHLFVSDLDCMRRKLERYALLWALRFHEEGRRGKCPPIQRVAHLVRELVLKRAAFTGRREAYELAVAIAGYHSEKYRILREVAEGRHDRLVALLREDRLVELFAALPPLSPVEGSPRQLDEARGRLAPLPISTPIPMNANPAPPSAALRASGGAEAARPRGR